ncbi:hypothetical protein FB45DRAFT_1097287 [Roridomyces roridus]|uniref:MYND-type domain-containing protein n=1 Tax=Roridomyces roridus TaxID=1738132 RepID=A0AAD7BER9_9AGAR|nr:hypothetical protein FB45DRAFT_1097287 [Roridomyces roridus]
MQDPKRRDSAIRNIRCLQKAMCNAQANMNEDDAPSSLEVQERWMSASPTRRGEIILAGLVAACTTIPTLSEARCLCAKELSVESHRQNGRLFLDLLEEMRAPNLTARHPYTPTYVSHPVWDAIVASQKSPETTVAAKTALAEILADRNMLIVYVVHFALRTIFDASLPELSQVKTGSKPRNSPETIPPMLIDSVRATCGEEVVQQFVKVARRAEKGRQVSYCSSECQKIDWKASHKKACGKLLQLEDLTP